MDVGGSVWPVGSAPSIDDAGSGNAPVNRRGSYSFLALKLSDSVFVDGSGLVFFAVIPLFTVEDVVG